MLKNKKTNRYVYLIIIILSFVLYGNTLKNDYAVDDSIVLTENAFTQNGISGIRDIFTYDISTGYFLLKEKEKTPKEVQEMYASNVGHRYRPLSLATFALEVSIFGKEITNDVTLETHLGNPFVSHLINLIIYILTTCLLFKILSTFFPLQNNQKWFLSLPFVATILFLAHPIHTEVVANIKGRDEMLTLLGSLGALWFSMVYCKNKKIYNLFLSGICLFLGLLSKENAITFLAIIPISLYFFSEKKLKTILITLIPLITASVMFLLIRGQMIGFTQPQYVFSEFMNNPFLNASISQKYATIFYSLWLYIKLLLFPHPLTSDYYPLHIEIINFSNPKAFIPLLIYLFLAIYAIYTLIKKDKNPIVSWSIWIYLLSLSIVSNLFFPIGTLMNDRFIFISSIGFCVILAWLFTDLIPRYIKNKKLSQSIISICLTIILCLYSIKTISRNKAWENDYVLYTTDVKISSNSVRCNRYAGQLMLQKAKLLPDGKKERAELYRQAIVYLEKSVKLYPEGKHSDALYLLADAYYNYNYDIPNTLKYLAKSLSYNNYIYDVVYKYTQTVANNVNELLSENKTKSSLQEILKSCDEILKAAPDFGEIIHLKAVIYGKHINDLSSSIKLFEEANSIQKFEKSAIFYKDMGIAYAMANNYEKALDYMLLSIELGDDDYRAYRNIAIVYQNLGDIRNANKYYAIALEMENRSQSEFLLSNSN
ncbi:MAG: hypothetical protein FWC34_07225 [Bacteroidetes bacterium]|nr:hypothetical protein [Bacteroidota bacterium]MCL2303355.1 hypothetical protein [Lentimicrobiaceae bacterium]